MIEMLNQITDSFFSKLMEKLVDYVFDTFLEKKNMESTLETLRNKLNSLSNKAFDVEEKIKEEELSGNKKRKREVEEWLKQVKLMENKFLTLESEVQTQGFVKKFIGGDQPKQLNIEVEELVEQSRHFGNLLVNVYERRGEEFLTTKMSGQGFKRNLKRIWNLLKSDQVSSIGIYGMGGVGKTALARHINNIILEKRKEMRIFWITVSQAFTIRKLQAEIARFIHLDLSDEDDEDKRAARLHRATGNNFLLILDDVWEYVSLEKLGNPLCLEGCKLILTTRLSEVCWQMGCQEKVEVGKLCKEEAWNLFKEKLGQDVALCPEVENVAKLMVNVCDGLPLGIIVLAGTMRGETSIHVWRNELEKLRDPSMVQDGEEEEVFKVLKYSFDRLLPNHQLCLLHCSLYPEDDDILIHHLIRRFISDELVDKRKSRRSQLDQGRAILKKLVDVCLLEVVMNNLMVKMHDLVRVMALKITRRTNMVKSGLRLKEISNEEEWIKDLEKVSFMYNEITEIPDGISPECPNLRTLILFSNPLKFLSDSFFSRLGNLCSLDLSSTYIEKLPNSLSNLQNLTTLNLAECKKLVYIPHLGKLNKLRHLYLSATAIEEVPRGMEELVNLRSVSLIQAQFLNNLPKGLFLNFPHLQCLHLPFQIKAPLEEIVRLKHLEEFWGRVKNMSELNKYVRCRQNQLTTSSIMVSEGVLHEDILPGWCTYNLENKGNEVTVHNFDLKNEEEEDSGMLGHDIEILILKEYKGLSNSLLDDFLKLDKPSSLNKLDIFNCREIKCILTDEQFLKASQELELRFLPFQNLQYIQLSSLQNFIGLIQNTGAQIDPPLPQAVVFCSLQFLSISNCDKMRTLGLPPSEFQNLEKISIQDCDETEEIVEVRDGEGQMVTLPKLKKLRVWYMLGLKSICNRTMFCASIKIIELRTCPELKKLPLFGFPNLEEISIEDCGKIEEIIEVREGEGHVVSLPKLKLLTLWKLPRLTSICNKTMSCDSVKRICVMACQALKKLPLHFDPISPSPPQTLEEIMVSKGDEEWWESLEWEHPTHRQLLQPFVQFS